MYLSKKKIWEMFFMEESPKTITVDRKCECLKVNVNICLK